MILRNKEFFQDTAFGMVQQAEGANHPPGIERDPKAAVPIGACDVAKVRLIFQR